MIELSVSLASNGVVKVPGYEQLVRFGYTKNRGVYRLAVTSTGEWEGLAIRCFWHVPDGKDPVSSLVKDGSVAVPASVTAQPGNGCITFEGSDGTRTVTSADLRYRVAANSGTDDGSMPEPGTPAWQELVGAVHTDATAAEQAKTDAQTAAQQAGAAAQKAAASEKAAGDAQKKAAESLQELKNGIASGNFKGEPGTSPTVTVQDITGGHRIVITDATGTSSVDVLNGKQGDPGKPGDTGATPELTIGTVKEGDAPSATITGTVKKPILNLTLKSGAPGKDATVDATLTQSGKAADAKVTGDALATKAVIDDTTVGTDAWSAKHLVDVLCPPLEETGNPIVCCPMANYPLGCKVSWEPTQQGEGTPYPAGGGPNLLDISQCTATVGKPYGVTITIDGDVFKVSGVPSSEVTEEGQYSFAVASCTQTELRGKGYKITPFALKGSVSSAWGLRTEDEDSLAIAAKLTPGVNTDIQLRLMVSKDIPAAYAPYENIRSIKGRDSVTVERCGENLLDVSRVAENKNCTVDDSTIHVVDTSGWGASYILLVRKYPAGTYTIQIDADTAAHGRFLLRGYDASGNMVDVSILPYTVGYDTTYNAYYKSTVLYPYNPSGTHKVITFTVQGAAYFQVGLTGGLSAEETSADLKNFALVPGSTAPTTYAPYIGQANTLALPSTIYGGTVDAVTGEGQETRALLTLTGTERIYKRDKYNLFEINLALPVSVPTSTVVASHWSGTKTANTNALYAENRNINVGLNTCGFDTVDDLKSYLAAQYAAKTPVQIAYKLATPVPFTATGAQPIPALPGVNTVLTDADSVTVTGRADPIKRITDLEDAVASMTNT